MTHNTANTSEPVWDSRNQDWPEGQRERFEAWVTSFPYDRSIVRFEAHRMWAGHYEDIAAQLAWEAWQEALTTQGEGR